MVKPKSEKELAAVIAQAQAPFEVIGCATKRALGRPIAAAPLDLSAFSGVIAYEPEELILECGAATQLSVIEKALAAKGQMLAFEPPDYSALLDSSHAGSIGGALACNLAGPRRLKAGAARDHILGLTGVNGQGEVIRAGARVVKNVTGYDVPRLMAGSYGTLMAFTSVIFKVLPRPDVEQTCHFADHGPQQAVALMAQLLATGAEISSAAYVPKQGSYVRIEGFAPSVKARVDLVRAAAPGAEVLNGPQSRKLWQAVRDAAPLLRRASDQVWRIVLPAAESPGFLARLDFPHTYFLDWAGGLIWLAAASGHDPRRHLREGHALLFRATAKVRGAADVFQPQPPGLAALSARVKHAFDPSARLNPGRMYKGL